MPRIHSAAITDETPDRKRARAGLRSRTAAAVLATATALAIACGGASVAGADPTGPGAPPVTGDTYARFLVPDSAKNAALGHVEVFGYLEGLNKSADPNSILVELTCGGTLYPVKIGARRTSLPSWGDAVVFTRQLPLAEVGHTCFVLARSKVAGQTVTFARTVIENDWNADRVHVTGNIIIHSRTGGL